MRRRAFWAALPLVAVVAVLALWWTIQGRTLMSGVKEEAAAELTRAFGTPVSVGKAELTAWNVVTLYEAKILDRQGRVLAGIPEASLEIDPVRLLRTRQVVESIARVGIDRPEVSFYRDPSGKWNVDELLTRDLPESRAFRGKLTLTGGQVFLHEDGRLWQIAPVAGTLDFAENPSVRFRLNLRGQEQRARMFGTFSTGGGVVVTLQGQNQDLGSWQGLFPKDWPLGDLKGRVASIDVTLRKDREGLKFAGEIVPAGVSGRFAGIDWSGVAGLITFSEQEVQLYRVTGKVSGQDLVASGRILHPLARPELQVRLQAASIDPSAVDPSLAFVGRASFEAELSGPWQTLHAAGNLKITDSVLAGLSLKEFSTQFSGRRLGEGWTLLTHDGRGGLAGQSLEGLELSLEQQDGRLTLQALSTRLGGGSLAASGTLTADAVDVKVIGAALPLGMLSSLAPELRADGALDFTGQLTGTPEDPAIRGTFLAADGKVQDQPFRRAMGGLAYSSGTLSLDAVEVRNGRSSHQLSGWVNLSGKREIDMRIATRAARAEDLAAWLAPGEALTGNIDNEVRLRGSVDAMEAEGKLTLWEGSYRGFLLSKVSGTYRRSHGVLSVPDLEIDSFNVKATLSGTMDAERRLNFTVQAPEVETAYVQLKYPYPVQGSLSLNGTLTGTTQKPEFRGDINARTLRLNGQDLFDISGQILLRRDEVEVSALKFLLGKGQVRANGGYREKTEEIFGGLSVENAELGGLLTLMNTAVKGVSGRLDGQVALTGTVGNPSIQLFGTLHAGRVKGYALDSIELDVALRNNVVTVNEFRARQGTGFVLAKGTADLNGPLAMEIGGRDIDAGILAAWLDSKAELKGKMDFLAQLSGTASSPQAGLSLDIRDGGVTNATFDRLYGLFVLRDDIIRVNQLYITKGEHRASAYGTLPLKALKGKAGRASQSAADTMDLRLGLDHANLSILPLLSPEVQWAEGATQGEVLIGGTLSRPVFSGRVSIADGAVKLRSLADPLEKLGIDIQFEGDTINVTRVSGTMGSGSFLLQGTASLNGDQGVTGYQAKLDMDRFGIRHKYFKGPLSGNLTLTRQNGSPLLAGRLLFENTTVNVPGIPETPQSELDVEMDVEIAIGKGVRAFSPSLYDIWIDGGLHLGGSVRDPRISGKINFARGSLEYIGSRFRIQEGYVDFPRRRLEPQVHLEAYANLSQTKVLLNIDGPASKMDLKLSSIPALSPQEIRTVLAFRPRSGDVMIPGGINSDALAREEMQALLTSGLRMQMFGEFENTFRNAFGLDDFRLVSGSRTTYRGPVSFGPAVAGGKPASLQEVYNLEFSKYIGDHVEVSYSMGLNRSEFLASIRYDLTQKFSLNASVDERNSPRLGLEYRIRF